MRGKIIKGIAGFYYVSTSNDVYECKAKGAFRNKKQKPLVGDNVEIEILDTDNAKGNITSIYDRKNELIRPAVANVDQAMIIFSVTSPEPNFNLLDRFLVMMEFQNVKTIICFNKSDLGDEHMAEAVKAYKDAGYSVVISSTIKDTGVDEIANLLRNKTTVLAGPSGVGKSSMLNIISKEKQMDTGTISEKIGRGKHTTRHSELFEIEKDTYIMDTPGFSSLEVWNMEANQLRFNFPEFLELEGKCKFNGCVHVNEPGCAVKNAIDDGLINGFRYENYKMFYEDLKNRKKY